MPHPPKRPKRAGHAGVNDPFWTSPRLHTVFCSTRYPPTRKEPGHGALSVLQSIPVDSLGRSRCLAFGMRSHISAPAYRGADLGCLHTGRASPDCLIGPGSPQSSSRRTHPGVSGRCAHFNAPPMSTHWNGTPSEPCPDRFSPAQGSATLYTPISGPTGAQTPAVLHT